MKIEDFEYLHKNSPTVPIESLAQKWEEKSALDSILSTTVASGLTLADLMVGDGLTDVISPELYHAFNNLMGEKAETTNQVKLILQEKLENGPESVLGLINKIKGQVGEDWFVEEARSLGLHARLADLGNQEAWDVAVDHFGKSTQYVQVKMYTNPEGIVGHIEEVHRKLQIPGLITDRGNPVSKIDFAIPEDTIPHVQRRIEELGIDINLIPMKHSAADAADIVQTGFDNIDSHALQHLFGELLGSVGNAALFHGLANAFLVYKRSKSVSEFFSDTAIDTGITTTGIASAMAMETLLTKLSLCHGLPSYALIFATSVSTRIMLRQMKNKRDLCYQIKEKSNQLECQLQQLKTLGYSKQQSFS